MVILTLKFFKISLFFFAKFYKNFLKSTHREKNIFFWQNIDLCQGEYYSFRGIPYAEAPVGSLVWRDPEPVHNWDTEVGGVILTLFC